MSIYRKIRLTVPAFRVLFLLLLFPGLFIMCSKKTEMEPDENWVRIYDHSDFNRLFSPLDVKEIDDQSFLILASSKPDTTIWPVPFY